MDRIAPTLAGEDAYLERSRRFECLKLANEMLRFGFKETPEEIVARAKAYEGFVDGTHHHAESETDKWRRLSAAQQSATGRNS